MIKNSGSWKTFIKPQRWFQWLISLDAEMPLNAKC